MINKQLVERYETEILEIIDNEYGGSILPVQLDEILEKVTSQEKKEELPMENALRWRIEKAQKEIQRLQQEGTTIKKEVIRLQLDEENANELAKKQYELGLIDGQIMAHKKEVGTLEDMVMVHWHLEKQKKLREVI